MLFQVEGKTINPSFLDERFSDLPLRDIQVVQRGEGDFLVRVSLDQGAEPATLCEHVRGVVARALRGSIVEVVVQDEIGSTCEKAPRYLFLPAVG